MVIQHNIHAMFSNRQLGITSSDKAKSQEKLSSGYRINRAADNAAGLSISEKLRFKIRGLERGSTNCKDGVSLCQIADGALDEVGSMLHRMEELSVSAANGTKSESDRMAIQSEINQLNKEIDRIADTTTFNGMPLFAAKGDESTQRMVLDSSRGLPLVTSGSSALGRFSEVYTKKDGSKVLATTLDFSRVTDDTVKEMQGRSFSFVCHQGCDETFQFTLDGSMSSTGPVDKTSVYSDNTHYYTIGIGDAKNGKEIVGRIREYVTNHPPTSRIPGQTYTDGQVSHDQWITSDGNNTLIVYTSQQVSSAEDARRQGERFSGNQGIVDLKEITKSSVRNVDDFIVNEFNLCTLKMYMVSNEAVEAA